MAIPAQLWLKDDGGADIKGSVDVQDREGSIEVTGFTHNLRLSTDAFTGKITGTRKHAPLVFQKEIDSFHMVMTLFTVYEQLKSNVTIDDQLTLYITQVEKSALSKNTYHYYFYDARKSAENFMAHVKDVEPIMITDDDKATAQVKDGQIYLRVRGNVYSFRSVGYNVRIHLDASPY